MPFKRRFPKKFAELWTTNYQSKSSFVLPANKKVAYTVRTNVPDADFLNCGISHIVFNDGRSGVTGQSTSAVFISNPNYIKAATGGSKPLSQYTKTDCENAVTSFISAKGILPAIVTTGSSETNPSNFQWGQDYEGAHGGTAVPQQYHWIDQAWANQLGSLGMYFGDYDGCGGTFFRTAEGNIEQLRAGFQSNQGAWDYMSTHTSFGNPMFTGGGWQYRHALVKTYWDGAYDPRMKLFGICTDLLFAKKALAYKGSDKKVMSFAFPNDTEFQNRQEQYKRTVGNGIAFREGFPTYGHNLNTLIGMLSLIHADVLFCWEDTMRYGNDPNIVAPEAQYSGSASKAPSSVYEYTAGGNVGYPAQFQCGHNAMLTGVEFYCAAVNWASDNITYAPSRTLGGSYNSNNSEYLINTFKANQPVGFVFTSGSRRALFCYDLTQEPGRSKEYEWDCGGITKVVNMLSGVPYLWLGEI